MNLKVEDIEQHREVLKQAFLQIAYVPDKELSEFVSLFKLKIYPKNSIIIPPNDTEIKGYFVVRGLVRMHYLRGGKEITEDFRDANSFFLNGYTYFTKQPNFDCFTALEEVCCLEIDWKELEAIFKLYHTLEHLGRKVVEMHYAESMRVSYNSLFLSVDDRYKLFLKEKKTLINRVPLKYVATYLGITQETLSRLRAKFL